MGPKCGKLLLIAGVVCLSASALLGVTPSTAQSSSSSGSKKPNHTAHHKKSRHARVRGQKAIDTDRTREIQEALIREHYLKGQPSGKWDSQTQAAMQRYQADQGWQSKLVPDSRALIRLGLGPDQEHLLNPESAMTTEPAAHNSGAAAPSPASSKTSAAKAPVPVSVAMPPASVPAVQSTPSLSAVPSR